MVRKIKYFISKNKEYIGIICLFIVSILLNFIALGNNLKNKLLISNTLDFSWSSDIVERFIHGFIAGKDFIFTYGPLYQFVLSVPYIILKTASYSSIVFGAQIINVINWFIFLLISSFLTNNKSHQFLLTGIFILIFGFNNFLDSNSMFRILIPMFYSLTYFKIFLLEKDTKIDAKKLIVLCLPAVFGLYIYELFISCVLIIFIFMLYSFCQKILIKKNLNLISELKNSFIQIVAIIGSEIITSFILSGNLIYLKNSLVILSDYRYLMNIPFSKNPSYILYFFPMIITFFLILSIGKKFKLSQELSILSLVALFSLRTSFIRNDDSHVYFSVISSIIVLILIMFFNVSMKAKKALFISAIFIFLLFNLKHINPTNIYYLNNLMNKNINFFEIYQLNDNNYINSKSGKNLLEFIKNHNNEIFVFPYNNFLLNIVHKTYNSYPLQFYDFSNSNIEKLAVEKFNNNPPKYIIYEIDKNAIEPIDNIPNFTRNPKLSYWIINNYQVYFLDKNYLILSYKKNKLIKNTNKCTLYELDLSFLPNFHNWTSIIKPSTYYINYDYGIRLPFTKNDSKFLIFDKYYDSSSLEKLFNNIDSEDHIANKNVKIIKKTFIPGLNREYSTGFKFKCLN